MHSEGKTDEARADLARLAIIRQQREEAAKKREEEKQGKHYFVNANYNNNEIIRGKNVSMEV